MVVLRYNWEGEVADLCDWEIIPMANRRGCHTLSRYIQFINFVKKDRRIVKNKQSDDLDLTE